MIRIDLYCAQPALPKLSSREQQQLVGYIDMVGYQIDHKVN